MRHQTFRKQVESEAEKYSDRFIDGTREGMAMMRLLGFKRKEYSISSKPLGIGNGWEDAKILFTPGYEEKAMSRVLANIDKVLDAEFDIDYFVFPQNPQINFIIMQRTCDDVVIAEKHTYLGDNKTESTVMKKIDVSNRYK